MIQPGLERISLLLKNVDLAWKAIHVAGTNGKGSVCAYAHAMLLQHGIPCARFTSPHLIDRWDCIHINNKPVSEKAFKKVESHFIQLNRRERINASEFELLTATAFQLFNDHNVTIGVVEVGMGGKLDATNILNNQCVSVINKIAFDHQNFLGNTLEDIARHKAGILRPGVPYLVNPSNELNVKLVIDDVAKEIGAGPRLDVVEELKKDAYYEADWAKMTRNMQLFQRENAALAFLAVREALGSLQKPTLSLMRDVLPALKTAHFHGRLQRLSVPAVFGDSSKQILIDGAHNQDAARVLAQYVATEYRNVPFKDGDDFSAPPAGGWPVTWVMAMSEGKDPANILKELLRPGDDLVVTTFGPVDGMPWVKSMDPEEVLQAAHKVAPEVTGISIPERSPHRALMAAKYMAPSNSNGPIVLTGSLYLMGDFWREKKALVDRTSTLRLPLIEKQERHRIGNILTLKFASGLKGEALEKEIRRLEEEIQNMTVSTEDEPAQSP